MNLAPITKSSEKLPDGTTSVGLVVRGVSSAIARVGDVKFDVAVRLDPKHDLLPAEIIITKSQEKTVVPDWAQHWKIREYRETLDERSNRKQWFPFSGVLTQGNTGAPAVSVVVEEVRINPPLPPTLFRPEIPDGATVVDNTSNGRGQAVIKGRTLFVANRMNELTSEANKALDAADARPRLWIILVANAAIVAVVILLFWWRRRRAVAPPRS